MISTRLARAGALVRSMSLHPRPIAVDEMVLSILKMLVMNSRLTHTSTTGPQVPSCKH